MWMIPAKCAAPAAALLLAACGSSAPPPMIDPVMAPAEARVAQGLTMIDDVSGAQLGRTRDGFLLSAQGSAAGASWRTPRLRPRLGVAGPDGFIEFDFMAAPPAAAEDTPGATQRLRADTVLAPEQVRGSVGARVHGRNSVAEIRFPATGG